MGKAETLVITEDLPGESDESDKPGNDYLAEISEPPYLMLVEKDTDEDPFSVLWGYVHPDNRDTEGLDSSW